MSLYKLPKDILIYLITIIQEKYKIENMSNEELRILKKKISNQIVQIDTKKTKDLLLSDMRLIEYRNSINMIESVKISKNSLIISIKTVTNEKAKIYKYLENVYFFPENEINPRHYYRYKLNDIPNINDLSNPEFLNLIFETYRLGYWGD